MLENDRGQCKFRYQNLARFATNIPARFNTAVIKPVRLQV
ncbi:hypothetical protein CKA32_000865 [Geitlerinema sp. FC II]|nr:hypothetical protein CKA32_000865 [Geitlerinema sp. FC II]